MVCQGVIEFCRELKISPEEVWASYTRSQFQIIQEGLARARMRQLHDQAVIVYTAVNQAICSAFGERSTGFQRFLDQFDHSLTNGDEVISEEQLASMRMTHRASGGMDDWEDL